MNKICIFSSISNKTIKDALDIMSHFHISGVPVVNDGQLVGILTNRDIRFETNLDLLVGTWSYASILIYENTECIGENEIYDYTAIVTYGDTTASIQGTKIWAYEEELLEDEEYTQEEFISNCTTCFSSL